MAIEKNNNFEGKSEIRLNRKMRTWHKYKNYCIIGGGAVGLVLVLVLVINLISGGSKDGEIAKNEQTTPVAQVTQEPQPSQSAEPTTEPATQQPTTAAASTLTGKAEKQSFSAKDKFAKSVFTGDAVMKGISDYGYLDSGKVVAGNNMTSNQLVDKVDSIMSSNPENVFIMVGLNDANYGNRSSDYVVEAITKAVKKMKEKNSSTKVYVLSVLPVTKAFEGKQGINVKQSFLDEVNTKLSQNASSMGAVYIDVATSYKDSEGYLMSDCTTLGSNLANSYYPFLLNGIAEAVK